MASKRNTRQKIEPSFVEGGARDDSRLDMDAGERVSGGGRSNARVKNEGRGKSEGQGASTRPLKAEKTEKAKRVRPPRKRGGFTPLAWLRSLIYWTVVAGIWGGIVAVALVVYFGLRMPSANTWAIPERPPNAKILDLTGDVVANRGTTGGEALALQDMSPFIPQAVMAIEDRRFYSHFGIDPFGIVRAFVTNLSSGRTVQGGSTLTQQLAKNLFLSPDQTLERKVQEVLLALWLEQTYTKDQILTLYLNRMFFGSNAYGVEAASWRYFNKSARDVNLGEAAVLAGVLKAPTRLSPARDADAAEARAQVVLGAMREQGLITDEEVKTAMSQPPTKAKSFWSGAQYYAADLVMDELTKLMGTIKEDVVVETTLDSTLEQTADKALNDVLKREGGKLGASQAALVSVDGTGAIRAIVGGRDYAESQFDRAVKARRQPGSAFKPFVYAAAMEAGSTPASTIIDGPVRIGKWTPENFDQKYRGQVTLAYALANSLNTVAAQLVMQVGPANVIQLAHRLGIESELQNNASIALGTSEVSLLELTSAYAPFMNGGFKATPHIIRRITATDGRVLYENAYDSPPRVLDPAVVAEMNQMMLGGVEHGTGKNAQIKGWQVAGKTGTTQSFRDALFVGFTADLTTGVWFGNDDGKSMKKVTGGGLPAKAWAEFMTSAHRSLSPRPLFGTDSVVPTFDPAQPADAEVPIAGLPAQGHQGTEGGEIVSGETVSGIPGADGAPDVTAPGQPGPRGDAGWGESGFDAGAPMPPADVGAPPPAHRRTTLLDFLTGG
ncbi:penicillin-binding protein [Xaviernesmea oryzae]|uniref:Penicillin-binding protein n=1 Tax=Xaviernesmea oryzae TaxID=464029 RepID=A0A1Q9AUB6_9HYPH|nr:transglycosylase domain-containing protein [Xaviernesmea oryzae]OLP59041.1 penicillin-binding protein [Xaviernesmea oryzae]SEK89361.1 penicillin-binding protein 1A [Xaviernesmea oryzae]